MGRRRTWAALLLAVAAAAGAWLLVGGSGTAPLEDDPGGEEAAAPEPAAAPAVLAGARRPASIPAATASFRVRGVVADAAGAPVSGVRVTARRTGPVWDSSDPTTWGVGTGPRDRFARDLEKVDAPRAAEEPPSGEATCDAAGRFEVAVVEPGVYEVAAWPAPPAVGTRANAHLTAVKPEARADLTVLAGTRLSGRVVDAADRGLAAVVRGRWETASGGAGIDVAPVATDAATGAFAFEAVPDGKGALTVALAGRALLSGIAVRTPYEGTLVIRVGGGGTLRGRVADAAGEPIAGADLTVAVAGPSGAPGEPTSALVRAKSGSDGGWRVEGVPPGRVTMLQAGAPGYTILSQSPPRAPWSGAEVTVGGETTIDVLLRKGGAIVARAVEAGTGAGIPGVEVRLPRGDAQSTWYGPTPSATTDAEGRVRFDDVALGKYVLIASSDTHYSTAVEAVLAGGPMRVYDPSAPRSGIPGLTVVLATEGETAEREIEMRRGLPVSGRVVGPDGAGIEGARVRMASGGLAEQSWTLGIPWFGGDVATSATSGSDGSFETTGLPPREAMTLVALKDGWVGQPCEPFRLAADAPAPRVTLELRAGASVTGRVLDADGKPLSGWNVWCWSMEARGSWSSNSSNVTTDADGAFALRGLSAGKGRIQANGGNGGNVQKDLDPPLEAGEARQGVELRVERGVEVSGILVDPEGKPVAGQSLGVSRSDGAGQSAWTTTKSDGTFAFSGAPEGRVRISVNEMVDDSTSMGVVVGDAVDAPARGLRLVYSPRKRTAIRGRVTDAQGRPVPLCILTVGNQGQRMYGNAANPDEVVAGEFVRLAEGNAPWTLKVSHPRDERGLPLNLAGRTVTVRDAAEFVSISLAAGSEVRGRLLAPDGAGLAGATVSGGGSSATTDSTGAFRLAGLAGDAAVDLVFQVPPRFVAPSGVRAKPGGEEVVVRVVVGARIRGRVLGPDGKPFRTAGIWANWHTPSGASGTSSAQIGDDGRFTIEGLPEDAVATINANPWSPDGVSPYRNASVANVRAGTEDVELRLEVGVLVEGRIEHADGTPAPVTWVRLAQEASAPVQSSTQVLSDGTFKAGPLAPGTYLLTPMGRSGRPLCEPQRVTAPSRGVRIVVPPASRIEGRVEGALPGVAYQVCAWVADESVEAQVGSGQLRPDGTFAIEVPGERDYFLGALYGKDDRYALAGPVRAGATGVVLRFQPGAAIEGILADEAGTPKAATTILAKGARWQAFAKTDADGRFRIRGLPPGRYQLVANLGTSTATVGEAEAGAADLNLRVAAPR